MVKLSWLNILLLFSICGKALCENIRRDVPNCVPSSTSAPAWAPDVAYSATTLTSYDSILYECLQSHYSQPGWTPPATPDLWATPTPCGKTPWMAQVLYAVGSVVTYNGVTYTCIQSHESEQGWTPDQTPALWQVSSTSSTTLPSCITTEANGVITQHVEVTSPSNSTSTSITVIIDQTTLPGYGSFLGFGGSSLGLQVLLGYDELMSLFTVVSANGSIYGLIHWGSLTQGASNASYSIANGTIFGSIDNRVFNPFSVNASAANVTFVDGGPSPVITAAPGVNSTLQGLGTLVSGALQYCQSALNQYNSSAMLMPRSDRTQDLGHISDPYSDSSCNNCKIGVMAGVLIAEALCVAFTCWWSFGAGCALCTAGAAASAATLIAECEASGACCPVHCGSGGEFYFNPPSCCQGNEQCLDGMGHCCYYSQTRCASKACCNADQSCINSGPQQGTCCPVDSVCGNQCCPLDSQVCVAQASCCAPEDDCGTMCCNPVDPLAPPGGVPSLTPPLTCVDSVNHICCQQGQHVTAGICCWPGQIVMDGICCAPGNVACNGECCLGTCDVNGNCYLSITDAQCQAMGSPEGACSNHYNASNPSIDCNSCTLEGCCLVAPRK
jgi:hypothetical protein